MRQRSASSTVSRRAIGVVEDDTEGRRGAIALAWRSLTWWAPSTRSRVGRRIAVGGRP